jgi:hypothetical protein
MVRAAQCEDQQNSGRTGEDLQPTPCSPIAQVAATSAESTTTRYITSTSILRLPAHSLSTSMRFITSTRALTSTLSPTSTFDWPPVTSAPGHFPIPQIQGLIPGLRRALHLDADPGSLSLSPSSALSHGQARKESTIALPSTSTYPRISPPGFLYPENLVPKPEYSAHQDILMQQPEDVHPNASPYQPGIMGRADYELAYLPTGFKLLFVGTLALMVLAVIWVVMAWLVNFPPGTWSIFQTKKSGNGKEKKKREERRPIDKPSKYAPREAQSESITEMGSSSESDSATTSALPAQPFSHLQNNGYAIDNDQGIEMRQRQRPRHHHHRQQTHLAQPQTSTEHRRTSSSPQAGLRFSYTPTPTHLYISAPPSPSSSNISSPPNPFLDPPRNGLLAPGTAGLVKRNSTEWKRDRAVFFTSLPPSPSPSPSPALVPYPLETHDIEALEAGTAPQGYSRASSSAGSGDSPNGVMKKSLSWIDQGLELVDGAVDGLVARVGRWTEDGGGDEALLLPVARSGRGE